MKVQWMFLPENDDRNTTVFEDTFKGLWTEKNENGRYTDGLTRNVYEIWKKSVADTVLTLQSIAIYKTEFYVVTIEVGDGEAEQVVGHSPWGLGEFIPMCDVRYAVHSEHRGWASKVS